MKNILFVTLLFVSLSIEAKLLDKIAGIIDDNIVTLSQIQRMGKSISIKKNVAPMIYEKQNYSNEEFLNITINRFLIRNKLNELGFPVNDDQVEAQVKSNEKRLNVDREQLKTFLKTQNITYDEYFETLREAMEYSYFVSRVVTPLISVSDQEVKNEYIKRNTKDARLNIKYTLIDYSISKESKPKIDKVEFENAVKSLRLRSITPSDFSDMSASNLDDITEEGLAPELRTLLKNTDEGSLSNIILLNNQHHIFFVAKKDLVETENYSKQKDKIKDEIFEKNIKAEVAVWFEREKNKHFIKINL
jgi:peptidyl-prolyl cis-trans isomerase SurA